MATRTKTAAPEADADLGNAKRVQEVLGGHAVVGVKAMRQAMKDMMAVVERRNTVPVMACVLLSVGPSTMTLTASDLDLQLVQHLDLAEAGQGRAMAVCVMAGTLEAICAKLPGDAQMTLSLEPGSTNLRVASGRSRFDLPTLPATDFPVMSLADTPVQFEMPRATLQQLFGAVAFAQSTDGTRYYLNGIFLHAGAGGGGDDGADGADGGEQLKAVATDGHRLALMSVDLPDGAEGLATLGSRGGVIVGRKTVGVLARLMDRDEGPEIELALSARKLVAQMGAITLVAKLIDGEFPDYTRVIPTRHEVSAWVEPAALVTSAERVTTVSSDKTKLVRLDLTAGLIRTSVTSPKNGTAEEEIEATVEGLGSANGALTIGFNSHYLIEVLRHLTASPALMRMTDGAGPVLIMDAEDARRRFVLMPMRV